MVFLVIQRARYVPHLRLQITGCRLYRFNPKYFPFTKIYKHTAFSTKSNGSFTLHGTRTGTGNGTGTGVFCSHCSETGSGTGSGKYYVRMFTCPRNSSFSCTCICFCCFTRLIKGHNIVNS